MICFSTVQISLSSSGELALSASSPSFSRQAKRASGGTALGLYPNALCFTYSVVLSPHFRALNWILSFSFTVTRTAIRTSFPIHISPFGGLGAAPPKESADFGCDWDFCGTQSPCLLYRETHPAGHKGKRLSDTEISAYLCAAQYRKPLSCPLGCFLFLRQIGSASAANTAI